MNIAKFLRIAFSIEHLRWLLLTVLPQSVKPPGVSALLFPTPRALFKCKIVVEIISYYHTTKQFLLLLELIDHVLSISEYTLE